MAFGVMESALSKKGYVTASMERLWAESATVQGWFDVEAALAATQADLGVIPAAAAVDIARAARVTDELMDRITGGQAGNSLVMGLDALRANTPEASRAWVHFGATTQDILDTGRSLQIKRSLDLIVDELDELTSAVGDLAEAHAATLMVARTNGQHAVPTTLGMRMARWLAELRRSRARLDAVRDRALMVQFSGAAGTYASMGEVKTRVAEGVASRLGLVFEPIPWHASRDGLVELCCTLAIYGQSLAKIAEDLFDMQRTDLSEAAEALDPHLSGSSTMPQKRNPFATMKISVAARMAAGAAATVLMQPPGSYERDHRQLEVERDALPRIFAAVEGATAKLIGLLPRLSFDTERLAANAAAEGVLLVSEGIMMALAPHVGHEAAHDLLQEFSAEHRANGVSLSEFIAARPAVADAVSTVDLVAISLPESYTGLSEEISIAAARGEL